jgi:hypothetical protein
MAVRVALVVACAAAIVASAGDLLLLWVAASTRPALGLPQPPAAALVAGCFAGVFAIPLYGLGYGALARPLAAARPRVARLVRGAGCYSAVIGAVIHGMTSAVQAAEHGMAGAQIDPLAMVGRWAMFLLPLWVIAAALVGVASWLWGRAAWRGEAGVPRWAAWTNPAVGTLVFGMLGFASPLLQAFLLPAAPNLAHVVFFAVAASTSSGRRGM